MNPHGWADVVSVEGSSRCWQGDVCPDGGVGTDYGTRAQVGVVSDGHALVQLRGVHRVRVDRAVVADGVVPAERGSAAQVHAGADVAAWAHVGVLAQRDVVAYLRSLRHLHAVPDRHVLADLDPFLDHYRLVDGAALRDLHARVDASP